MKYRNQFLKYKVQCQTSPDGGDGGGNNGDNSDDNDTGDNNSDNNLPSFTDPWNNNGEGEGDSTATPQQITVVNAPEPKGAEAVFNDHVAGIDFTSGIDLANVQTALSNGDQEAFGKAMRGIGENAYRQSMIDMNKIINQRVDKAKEEMTTQSATATATERAVMQLNDALPYTKEGLYKPVADEVFTRYLQQKDMTVDKAIKKTGEYFTKLSGDIVKSNPQAPNARPSAGFGVIDENADDGDGQDWMSFLGKSD